MPLATLVPIINLTPDSFSDGGRFSSESLSQIDAWLTMKEVAALDIGAESTRPNATPISPEEEWQRLETPLKHIIERRNQRAPHIHISLDTRHPETAMRGIEVGVNWINDVSGLGNPDMQAIIAESGVTAVFMHSLSIPADPSLHVPNDRCPTTDILDWATQRLSELEAAGISKSQLIMDPGIGFGKTADQSWKLLQDIASFQALSLPLLVGHSRKSFLTQLTNKPAPERDLETALVTHALAQSAAVDYIRVHNVASNAQALRIHQKLSA